MIVAPTEPPKLRKAAGRVSLYPEEFGADAMILSRGRKVGIQRKELNDLVASLADGRLGMQMKQMAGLDIAVLLIEGQPKFSMDGEMMNSSGYGRPVSKAQYHGVLWSAMLQGIWVDWVGSLDETIEWLEWFEKWLSKDRHVGLIKREKVFSPWGTPGNRDFQRHLIMGVPGIGVELADRILDVIGMPFGLTVEKDDLLSVDGMGPGKVRKMMEAFGE